MRGGKYKLYYIMNENTDLMKKISEVDLNLVERVLYHLNYEDLEKRVLYAAYDMLRYFFFHRESFIETGKL